MSAIPVVGFRTIDRSEPNGVEFARGALEKGKQMKCAIQTTPFVAHGSLRDCISLTKAFRSNRLNTVSKILEIVCRHCFFPIWNEKCQEEILRNFPSIFGKNNLKKKRKNIEFLVIYVLALNVNNFDFSIFFSLVFFL